MSAGSSLSEEIGGCPKVGQIMPFFEFGIDIHECLVGICAARFNPMSHDCGCRTKFFEPRPLIARNL